MKELFKKPFFWLIAGAVLIIVFVIGGFIYYNANKDPIETEKAFIGSITSNIEANGTIEARQTVLIRWMSNGIVGETLAKTGDLIRSEQPLAILDLNTVGTVINNAYSDMFLAEDEYNTISNSNVSVNEARDQVSSAYEDLDIAQKHYDWVVAPRGSDALNEYLGDDIQAVDDQLKFMDFLEEFFYANMTDNNPKKIQFNIQKLQVEQSRHDQVARWNWFNSVPSQNEIDLAAGQLAVAQAAYDDAVRVYDRVKADNGQTELVQAEARVAADKSVVGQALLINTVDGALTMFDVKPGDLVRAGTVGARVDDLSELHVKLFLSEVDVNRVKVGGAVQVTSQTDPSLELRGTIRSIELAGRNVNDLMAYEVIVSIEGDTATLRPGNSVDLVIEVQREDQALLVPTKALRLYNGSKVLFVLKDGAQIPVAVRTGIRNIEYTQIVGGNLKAGDEIILAPPAVSTLEGVLIQ